MQKGTRMSQSTGASKKHWEVRGTHIWVDLSYMCKMKVALFPSNGKYSDLNPELRLGG